MFGTTLLALGCFAVHDQSTSTQSFAKFSDMQPATVPYEKAYVIFAGKPIPTSVKSEMDGGNFRLKFESNGVIQDEEWYVFDETTFRYAGTADDTFDPGIPLLRFPLNVGDEWTWAGTNRYFGDRDATATIKTSEQRLNTVVGEFKTVKVVVDLSIDSESQKPVERKLTFWFAPKKGIIRREIPYSTTREPMPPDEPK